MTLQVGIFQKAFSHMNTKRVTGVFTAELSIIKQSLETTKIFLTD